MRYICSVCGYIYDEGKEGKLFSDLPQSFVCPVCGASKQAFVREQATKQEEKPVIKPLSPDSDSRKLTPGELSQIFSDLARGCEKQYKPEAEKLYRELADYYAQRTPKAEKADLSSVSDLLSRDLDTLYPGVLQTAQEEGDRGTQRICAWGTKVTTMLSGLLDRYLREGEAFLAENDVYVCTVCGFVYVGKSAPALCPVCKVPDWKFEKIEGRRLK